jgi:PKD repeat protein/sugar lactone lactonase YvrE
MAVKAQTVSLFAGTRYAAHDRLGYSGNTSKIIQTQDSFAYPGGICADTTGKFWISDMSKMFILSGGYSLVRGGYTGDPQDPGAQDYKDATGTVSRFTQPRGLAVHPTTNDVYVCDYGNNVIRKGTKFVNQPNPSVWSTLAGVQSFVTGAYKDGPVASARFYGPEDIAITSTGDIYISDMENHCIRKISGGNVTTVAGDTIANFKDATGKSARFNYPMGICLENDNSLLVADRNNGKIRRVNLSTGAVSTVVSGLFLPTDVSYINGLLFIADHYCIRTWDGSKLRLYAGKYGVPGYANGSDSSARFDDLTLMHYDNRTKSLYVVDEGNNIFRKVTIIATPVADFWANKTAVSTGEVVTIHNSSVFSTSFLWALSPGTYTLENGSKLTDSMLYVSFSAVGSYTISLTSSNAAGNNQKTKNNYINVSVVSTLKPTADFIANKTNVTTADTVSLIEQSGNSPTSWAWSFSPTTVNYVSGTTSASRFPKVKFTAAGVYSVTLTATNANGSNGKTRTSYITVNTPASISNANINNIKIYPNPANNFIQFSEVPATTVMIFGLNGVMTELKTIETVADIRNLSAGIYFVRYADNNGNIYTGKFVKNND